MDRGLKGLALCGVLAAALAGCGSGGGSGEAATQARAAGKPLHMVEAKKVLHKPYELKDVPKGPAPSNPVVDQLYKGGGPPTREGAKVSFMYMDGDYADKSGKFFYSAWNTLKFFTFEVGAHEASPAWESVAKRMRLGGRSRVIMPASMVEGPKASPIYPKDAETVVFIADLYLRG